MAEQILQNLQAGLAELKNSLEQTKAELTQIKERTVTHHDSWMKTLQAEQHDQARRISLLEAQGKAVPTTGSKKSRGTT